MEEIKKIWRITTGNMLEECGKDRGFRGRNKKGLLSFDCKVAEGKLQTLAH